MEKPHVVLGIHPGLHAEVSKEPHVVLFINPGLHAEVSKEPHVVLGIHPGLHAEVSKEVERQEKRRKMNGEGKRSKKLIKVTH